MAITTARYGVHNRIAMWPVGNYLVYKGTASSSPTKYFFGVVKNANVSYNTILRVPFIQQISKAEINAYLDSVVNHALAVTSIWVIITKLDLPTNKFWEF